MEKYCVFDLEGGLGKHVAATAVAKTIKNNHPERKLIVVCPYAEVFLNLPFVDRVYKKGNTPYFYDDYIKGKDTLIFKHEPYFTNEHIHKKLPLIENWVNLYNLDYNNEQPELRLNLVQQGIFEQKWTRDKPILLIHTNGGPMDGQKYDYSWTRDLPRNILPPIIDTFKNDYHIIQVCRKKEQSYGGIESVFEPMGTMEYLSIIRFSSKRLLIDSSLQHASKAFGLNSTVLWLGTSPSVFGHDTNYNFVGKVDETHKLPDSYFFDYGFNGELHECPLFDPNIFDINQVIQSIIHQ